jgi:hypothetical protein
MTLNCACELNNFGVVMRMIRIAIVAVFTTVLILPAGCHTEKTTHEVTTKHGDHETKIKVEKEKRDTNRD